PHRPPHPWRLQDSQTRLCATWPETPLAIRMNAGSAPAALRVTVGYGREPLRYTVAFMSYVFRQAICNEAFDKWPFAEACKAIRKAGYSGIEIAPFTLAETPASITGDARREYRDIIASEGLQFVG